MGELEEKLREVFEKNNGILKLIPSFVCRKYSKPGKRLRLHPYDYYAYGIERGAIKVRYLSSVIWGGSNSLAPPDEGLSYVSLSDDPSNRILFKDSINFLGKELIGDELWSKYKTFPMHSKFFDFNGPLFHHLHLGFDSAERVGKIGKPEGYFFPIQYNNHEGDFPFSFFGLDPDVTKKEVRSRLELYMKGDNRITELSKAYRIEPETGWFTHPGVLHAPGSYLTYEPQWNSGVTSVFENVTAGEVNPYDFLVSDCPPDKKNDLDYIFSLLDWEKNTDPHYKKNNLRPKIKIVSSEEYDEFWIMYGNDFISAKQLVINPGKTTIVKDAAAYGCILVQGYGQFGDYQCETPEMIRLGQLTADEFFVSKVRAQDGVKIVNHSKCEPLVILKHFGPDNLFSIPISS
jgi:hypothetical protein